MAGRKAVHAMTPLIVNLVTVRVGSHWTEMDLTCLFETIYNILALEELFNDFNSERIASLYFFLMFILTQVIENAPPSSEIV